MKTKWFLITMLSAIVGLLVSFFDFLFHTGLTAPPETFGYYLVLFITGFMGAIVGFRFLKFKKLWMRGAIADLIFDGAKGLVYLYANLTYNAFLTCCSYLYPLTFPLFGISDYARSVILEGIAHYVIFLPVFIGFAFVLRKLKGLPR